MAITTVATAKVAQNDYFKDIAKNSADLASLKQTVMKFATDLQSVRVPPPSQGVVWKRNAVNSFDVTFAFVGAPATTTTVELVDITAHL